MLYSRSMVWLRRNTLKNKLIEFRENLITEDKIILSEALEKENVQRLEPCARTLQAIGSGSGEYLNS